MTYTDFPRCDVIPLLTAGFSAAGKRQQQRQPKLKMIQMWRRTYVMARGHAPQLYPRFVCSQACCQLIVNIFISRKIWTEHIHGCQNSSADSDQAFMRTWPHCVIMCLSSFLKSPICLGICESQKYHRFLQAALCQCTCRLNYTACGLRGSGCHII